MKLHLLTSSPVDVPDGSLSGRTIEAWGTGGLCRENKPETRGSSEIVENARTAEITSLNQWDFAFADMTKGKCRCEERSDEAIQDWIATPPNGGSR
jgi:hypothetical protein